jgi:pimeloyl-ACP methyl ester carboxylesterase
VGVTTLAYLTGLLGRETRPARMAQRARIAERKTLVTPDGRSISYLRGGDAGETRLIFIHGSPANGSMFVNHVTSGAAGLERVAIDRLGFGFSTPDAPEPSHLAQARAIEPLLAAPRGQWPVVVGHSYGACIALRAAAEFAGKISGVAVVAGSVDPQMFTLRWYRALSRVVRPLIRVLPRGLRHADAELRAMPAEFNPRDPWLRRVACPVLILHGRRDPLTPLPIVEPLRRALASNRFVRFVVFDGDHFIPWTHFQTVRKELDNFVQVCADPSSAPAGYFAAARASERRTTNL